MGFLDRFRSQKDVKDETVLPVVEENKPKPKLRFDDEKRGTAKGLGAEAGAGAGVDAGAGAPSSSRQLERSNTSKTVKKQNYAGGPRPGLQRRTTAQTRYIDMLLSLDQIPRLHNILASLFTWLLLAGYIVFPATFTSITTDQKLQNIAQSNAISEAVLGGVKNAPLLYIAAVCCGVGVLGMLWLWKKHHGNYVWVINRIFLPGAMNSIAGLISTITNVYSAQGGQYSITAKSTTIVTSACSAVLALLFLLYNNWALGRVKAKHDRETAAVRQSEERQHEGVVDMVKRKAHEPGLEPESVV